MIRGIDVSGISHIINFDIPAFCDDYVHRVGRTGRMGREGIAYTFVSPEEGNELTKIEQRIDRLYADAYARPATPEEQAEAVAFLKAEAAALGLDEKLWTTDERPWADLCHVLVNVKEFLFVN